MAESNFRVPAIIPDEAEGLHQIRLNVQIPGLESSRTLTMGKRTKFFPKFERDVDNGKVTHDFKPRSLYIRFEGTKSLESKLYILSIKSLPGEIIPEKTEIDFKKGRIEIVLYKTLAETWIQDGTLNVEVELPK